MQLENEKAKGIEINEKENQIFNFDDKYINKKQQFDKNYFYGFKENEENKNNQQKFKYYNNEYEHPQQLFYNSYYNNLFNSDEG